MGNLRTVLAASAVALLLAACTNAAVEHSESASPSASVSVSASATATPTAGVDQLLEKLPEDARYPDLGGAIKTAEFFFTLYAPMFQSGDTTLWDALSLPGCVYCEDASKNAALVREGNWIATGGEISPDIGTEDSGLDGETAVVAFEADFADAYLAASGSTPELQEPASRRTIYTKLELVEGVWRVSQVMVSES